MIGVICICKIQITLKVAPQSEKNKNRPCSFLTPGGPLPIFKTTTTYVFISFRVSLPLEDSTATM
jgi:hypothetical protein